MAGREQQGYIYFLAGDGLVKIGFTTNLKERVRSISRMSPRKLNLIARLRGTQRNEDELHGMLKKYRQHGEWFRLEGDVVTAWMVAFECEHGQGSFERFLNWADKKLSEGVNSEPSSHDLGNGVLEV